MEGSNMLHTVSRTGRNRLLIVLAVVVAIFFASASPASAAENRKQHCNATAIVHQGKIMTAYYRYDKDKKTTQLYKVKAAGGNYNIAKIVVDDGVKGVYYRYTQNYSGENKSEIIKIKGHVANNAGHLVHMYWESPNGKGASCKKDLSKNN